MNAVKSLKIWLVVVVLLVSGPSLAFAAARQLPDFTGMVEKYGPAVVNISTKQKQQLSHNGIHGLPHGFGGPGGEPGDSLDDFLRRFFGDNPDDGGGEESESLGSGFIISRDGYVLTNTHVVRDADEIIVRLSDRRELEATVIGSDKRSDIALLKVDAKDLPTVKIGSPTKLKVGSWVLAIGSPFGFDHSVTAGIVSAKGRSLPNENYVPFIQTDVAINPGNSGGPLFNLDGEVVGVNSQIYSRTGGYMGLAFAIPIDMAMNVVEQLKATGHVKRGWLGVLIQDVTRELAESFGMPKPIGALVAKVIPDSPADKAGFQVGDVVVEYNGHEVESSSALPPMVGNSPLDEKADVKIIRNGKPVDLKVAIGELPPEDELAQAGGDSSGPAGSTSIKRIDISVSDLSDERRQKLDEDVSGGVYVESVRSGAAARAGVREGDVIIKANGEDVKDARQLKQIIDDLPAGKSFPILVLRRSGPVFLAIRISED
jgi:serine protease Do